MFIHGSKFCEQLLEIIVKSDQRFQRRLLKNCLKINLVAMTTMVFDGIKFCEQRLKSISHDTFLPSLVQIGRPDWEEKMFKEIVDVARRTPDTGPH